MAGSSGAIIIVVMLVICCCCLAALGAAWYENWTCSLGFGNSCSTTTSPSTVPTTPPPSAISYFTKAAATDYNHGNDYAIFQGMSDSSVCANECIHAPACAGFSMYAGNCYLKTSPITTISNPEVDSYLLTTSTSTYPPTPSPSISYFTKAAATDYNHGNDYAIFQGMSDSSVCANECIHAPACAGFSMYAGNCYLKTSPITTISNPEVDSYLLNNRPTS